jgi:hypothetical protein
MKGSFRQMQKYAKKGLKITGTPGRPKSIDGKKVGNRTRKRGAQEQVTCCGGCTLIALVGLFLFIILFCIY